jgi:hypothetical protein
MRLGIFNQRGKTMEKFIHAARADYEALYKDRDMILYLAELYEVLDKLDPENHSIDAHWSLAEEVE